MSNSTSGRTPPMNKSDEADSKQLELAREQGQVYQKALDEMSRIATHAAAMRAGDYLVACAVEEAEGMYGLRDGQFQWIEPQNENAHVEVVVRDGADGRFIPYLTVHATLIDASGKEIGTHEQPFLWHPWLFHYGWNWRVPGSGEYTLRVHIEPPQFMRHDKENGKRYAEPVTVEFTGVRIEAGKK